MVYPEAHAPLEQNSSVAATGVITLVNAEAEVASCETPPQPVETMQDRTSTMPGPRYNTSLSPLPQIMAEGTLQAMEQSFNDSEVFDPSSAYLSNIDEEFPPLSMTEVLEPVEPDEPPTLLQVQNARDTSDWQFPPALYYTRMTFAGCVRFKPYTNFVDAKVASKGAVVVVPQQC